MFLGHKNEEYNVWSCMYNVKVSGNKFIAYLVMLPQFVFILVGLGKVASLYDDFKLEN